MRRIFALLIFNCAIVAYTPLLAEDKGTIGSDAVEPLSASNLSEWSVGLLVVLLAIGLVAWLAKRFNGFGVNQAGLMRVVSGISVGNREKVLLIKAGDQHLLLGVAPGRIQTLHTFDKGEIEEPTAQQAGDFQQTIRTVLNKKAAE